MKNSYFTLKFNEAYSTLWKSKGKTQGQFAETMNLRSGFKSKVTFRYVSSWLKGTVPESDNIKLICEVLNLPEDYFIPSTKEDLYKYDKTFQNDVSVSLRNIAADIGLSISFFDSIIELINFDELFPVYSPLEYQRNCDSESNSLLSYLTGNGSYSRMKLADMYTEEQARNKDFQIVKGDNIYSLSEADLRYLKEVQDSFEIFLKVHFQSRAEEMKREEYEVNQIAQKKSHNREQILYTTGLLSEEELRNKDRFRKYVTGNESNEED